MKSPFFLALSVVLLVSAAGGLGCENSAPAGSGKPTTATPAKVTVGKDTTFIAGPLHADGYVDYVSAINDNARQGVNAENNAAVLIARACGLPGLLDANREEFLRRLETDAPAEGEFTLSAGKFARMHNLWPPEDSDPRSDPDEQVQVASGRPWSADEFPILTKWLDASKEPLNVIIEASERPKFYEPLVCGNNILTAVNLPLSQAARSGSRALVARAMLSLKEGKFDDAWGDLMACHRLARHVASAPCAVCSAVGLAMETMACRGDYAFASEVRDGQRLKQCLADMYRLAPLRSFANKLDSDERLIFLDSLIVSPRSGSAALVTEDQPINDALKLWIDDASSVDWDEVLRISNSWYDRGVAAMRHHNHADRAKALEELDRDLRVLGQVPKERAKLAKVAAGLASNADRTRAVTAMMVCLQLPTFTVLEKFESKATALLSLDRICLALEIWRTEHGKYPSQLVELAPSPLHEVPKDPFSSADFRYTARKEDYVLYSVGPNGDDENGDSRGPDHPEADDVSLFAD